MNKLLRNRSSAGVWSVMESGMAIRTGSVQLCPRKLGSVATSGKDVRVSREPAVRDERRTGPSPMRRSPPSSEWRPYTAGLLTGRLAVARARDERVRRVDADTAGEVRQLAVRVRREPGAGE